ncbi:MAG: CehA/McbA family metallohydrolase [Minicystis sp.]
MVHLLPSRTGRLRERKRTVKRRRHPPRSAQQKHQTPTPLAAAGKPAALPTPPTPSVIASAPAAIVSSEPAVHAAPPLISAPPPAVTEATASQSARSTSTSKVIAGVAVVAVAAALLVIKYRTGPDPAPMIVASASAAASVSDPPQVPGPPPRFAQEMEVTTFQKGNIHTHTAKSDGDSQPEVVYAWYRDHGYNFLAITDHNTFTDPKRYAWLEKRHAFVMISGEEITMMGAGKQVHVNGLCTKKAIGGKHFDSQQAALAWAVAEVKAQGGVSLVNHPNWDWALTERDIPAAHGASLLEIFSGHPFVRTDGDETRKSHEAIWDWALGHGELVAGVAVDDSHYFKPHVAKKDEEPKARPGRAWVEVFADEPDRAKICEALGKGRLYSSSGVKLKRITVGRETIAIVVDARDAEVTFVGREGRVLQQGKTGDDGVASYTLRGGEGYVRAKVSAAEGGFAWTQPAWLAVDPAPVRPPASASPER